MDDPSVDVATGFPNPVQSIPEVTPILRHQPRLTIGRMMIAIVIVAGVLALIRMMRAGLTPIGAALMLPLISVFALAPVRFAQPGRWLLISTWLAALWPFSSVVWLNAAFGIATVALGREPGVRDNGTLIGLLQLSILCCWISSLVATLAGLCLPLLAPNRWDEQSERWNPQTIPVLLMCPVWLLVIAVAHWDPFFAFYWFID